MKIQFLGSGSAFVLAEENYHSNILFTKEIEETEYSTPSSHQPKGVDGGVIPVSTKTVKKRLLFDAGTHIPESLNAVGLTPMDLDDIVVSHLHSDHCGGLEFIGFKTYFIPPFGTHKPHLIGNNQVIDTLWENVLKGTMQYVNGGTLKIDDYFKVTSLAPRTAFDFAGTNITLVQVPHVISDKIEVPSFGLKFTEDNVKYFITGDCQFDFWRLIGQYEYADVIFHDCEMMTYDNSVHAQFSELKELPEQYKAKMWLYHYMLYGKTFEELEAEVLEAGFAGLVARGQEFDTVELAKC